VFIDINLLERRKLRFDDTLPPGALQLPDNWRQAGGLRAEGTAELLDRFGSRTIRVRGHIVGQLEGSCGRCLEPVANRLDADFDLYYYPMSMIARDESVPIDRDDTDIGFYEGQGLELADVLREQILLWLPMRGLCREDCQGICSRCGKNRNREACRCVEEFVDSRWDALRRLEIKSKN